MSGRHPTFLSCDWGTTAFRLRLVEWDSAAVLREVQTGDGTHRVTAGLGIEASSTDRAQAFGEVLARQARHVLDHLKPALWPDVVVVSGMASSSVGWKELPYAQLPFPIDGSTARTEERGLEWSDGRPLRVLLVSGVASANEMMRGEETQVMGLLSLPAYADFGARGCVVLPGTHSKHVEVRDRRVVGLQTFMTGELFAVLCEHSLLRFTCGPTGAEWDETAFAEGVGAARTSGLMRSLFQVRTRGVLGEGSGAANRSFLSGLLIGAEWAAHRQSDDDLPILLAAPEGLARPYETAARMVGLAERVTTVPDGTLSRAVIEGHRLLAGRFALGES